MDLVIDKIKSLEQEIKQKEEELKQARKEMRKYDKYKHFIFTKYKDFGGDQYEKGLHQEHLLSDVRALAKRIVLAKKRTYNGSFSVDFSNNGKIKSLNITQMKICNDFIDELYPVIEKYINIVIESQEGI